MWLSSIRFLKIAFIPIFNVPFFILGGYDHTILGWISYGFIHLAYILLVTTPSLATKSRSSTIFEESIISISAAYFLLELLIGLILIFIFPNLLKVGFVFQFLVLALYLMGLFWTLDVKERVQKKESKFESDHNYIKAATHQLGLMVNSMNDDRKTKKELEKAYDAMRTAQVTSNAQAHDLEKKIAGQIEKLEDMIDQDRKDEINRMVKYLISTIDEREKKLR